MPKNKTGKRILSVKIKRMMDDSPDTSHMGEYSDNRTSEFSIDRAHAENCASVSLEAKQAAVTLEHAQQTVGDLQSTVSADYAIQTPDSIEWEALEEAYNVLGNLVDEVTECDCGERGDMSRHEYRYFNPSFNYVDKNGHANMSYTGEDGASEIRKYVRQDYERMERLNRGDWCYIGIRAEADIHVPYMTEGRGGRTYFQTQTITSGSLFGIESDSEKSFFADVAKEELSDLRAQLYAFGFSKRAIATAFQNVEEEN